VDETLVEPPLNDDETLEQLEQLDTIDREIARIEAAADRARQELADARSELERRKQARAEAAAALEANRGEERAGTRRLEDLRGSRASALRILETGAGSAEAAQRQLERCDGLIDEGETAQLELLEAQDGLAATLDSAESALGAAEAHTAKLEAEVPGRIQEHEAAVSVQVAARAPVADRLPRDIAERYRSFRQRGRWAVARIRDKTCESCAMTVQPQMIADLRRGRLVACHGCHRWLIPPPE
jgi:uncharacterized protein